MEDFKHINSFLDKFKKKLFQKEEIYRIISEEILNETKIKLNKDDIKIKNGIISVNCSPLARNQILINKKNILLKLRDRLPENILKDIR